MSATTFGFAGDSLAPVDDGASILLTGSDLDALESVFFSLMEPSGDERPLVVSTAHRATEIGRHFDGEEHVITSEGSSFDDSVTVVEDSDDLTTLGMELSAKFQEFGTERVRAGIFHTTDLCGRSGDTRSVYRFLNSNLMTHLRRQSAIGIGAIHTESEVGADVDSIVRGMETSFTGRIHVEDAGFSDATVTVDGLGNDGTFDIDL